MSREMTEKDAIELIMLLHRAAADECRTCSGEEWPCPTRLAVNLLAEHWCSRLESSDAV